MAHKFNRERTETMSDQNKFLLYTAPNGAVKVDVVLKDETVWLTQKALAELFGVQVPGINKHLKNIFDSGELVDASVISILETTATDGKNYQTRYYNLDAIIAVGYRVNSFQATQFRIWATKTLREFMIKGFVLDVDFCFKKNRGICERDSDIKGKRGEGILTADCADIADESQWESLFFIRVIREIRGSNCICPRLNLIESTATNLKISSS